ncbi:uncharacterized protein DUF4405 [Breznakibacter xylanolyticus]|uniref:Uncharacterized protein DUF4405 n=1 Tax=Breznakibacter xylanolyticus TaxID=990 RepID=A0A2W7NF33_9BACT|nr:DUF4405 domain-containing protein [Breznakibacter xylanolyticus]PZX11746.1 uncharacterized protein DUF4405 [Breznakibacter xylanolyticus]
MKNTTFALTINLALLISGALAIFSGLLLQLAFHIGSHADFLIDKIVMGASYHAWSTIHKGSSVLLSLVMIFHFYLHWPWYRTVVKKRLFSRNRQVLTLTVLFSVVAVTGFVPWIVKWQHGSPLIRHAWVEVHDKLAIVLAIYIILHAVKRLKWFNTAMGKLKTKPVS